MPYIKVDRKKFQGGRSLTKDPLTDLSMKERFRLIWSLVEKRIPLFLLGPAGSGKSYIGMMIMKMFAKQYLESAEIVRLNEMEEVDIISSEIKALYIAGSANVTKLDLLGGRTLEEGSYVRRKGVIPKMIKNGGIIFLDEVTSLPPQFNILLNELIDRLINRTCHPDFYIMFAGNPKSYLGANELPDSTLERLTTLWFDYYTYDDEVNVLDAMIQKIYQDGDEIFNPKDGYMAFLRFITGLIRRLREDPTLGQINLPLSVRSMLNLFQNVHNFSVMNPKIEIEISTLERLGLYQTIKRRMPKNLLDGWNEKSIEDLIDYMAKHKITWGDIRKSIASLGVIQKLRGTQAYELIVSLVPQ